jgi:hypothetical protein
MIFIAFEPRAFLHFQALLAEMKVKPSRVNPTFEFRIKGGIYNEK